MASLSTLSHFLQECISSLLTWKALALFLALINLKNLPLVWHARLAHHLYRNIRRTPQDPHHPATTHPPPHATHPIFLPLTISSRTPILETDYNFHKSNSTYFSDLDIARTALATRIFTPGSRLVNRELDAELASASASSGKAEKQQPKGGSKLGLYIALGSVFCSFKREIKPFERYEITSRVISWDEKWVYMISYFVRPQAGGKGTGKGTGKGRLLATALSKYVVKKGRVTVPPERVLRASGFLPERPAGSVGSSAGGSGSLTPGESGSEEGQLLDEGITATGTATGVDAAVVREVLLDAGGGDDAVKEEQRERNVHSWNEEDWPWERIEEERLRGLRVVEGYAGLDAKLFEEWGGE